MSDTHTKLVDPAGGAAAARRAGRPRNAKGRDAVLDAAERLVARLGYSRMTMDDIAGASGVGRSTLYHLFSGKEEIALAATDRRHGRLLAALRRIAGEDGVPCAERLRRMMSARVLMAFDSVREAGPPDYAMLAAIRAEYMERRLVYMGNEARVFEEVLTVGVRAGELAPQGDYYGAALALVQSTNALMPFSLSVRQLEGGRDEVAEQTGVIAGLLLDGLRVRPSPDAQTIR